MERIAISLISHTNAGKTTLARTLLQRDVGEVRDAPHVTEFTEDHLLMRSPEGDELRLWDTPGFGDTVRLVQRLERQGTALGWFLSEVWDRWRDRPFWANQQALRHVRDETDVVLYLVNAAESPASAAYVQPEMRLLSWIGKPVLVLLNQLGAARSAEDEAADVARWREQLSAWPRVADVVPMDAFARCWVQEGLLLQRVRDVLPAPRQAAMQRLQRAWWTQRRRAFEESVAVLAGQLVHVATLRIELHPGSAGVTRAMADWAQRVVARVTAEDKPDARTSAAQQALLVQTDEAVRSSTAELLRLHGLQGKAEGEILERVARQIELSPRVHEGRAALWGGVLSGALAGLKADVATGGLTLGGGMIAGGILGALGAAGLARGWNILRGGGPPTLGWSAEALGPMVEAAVLRYLAVAHFGRGRGQWTQGEASPHWPGVVQGVLQRQASAWQALWARRPTLRPMVDSAEDRAATEGERQELAAMRAQASALLQAALNEILVHLYPQAADGLADAGIGAQSDPPATGRSGRDVQALDS